MRFRDWKEFGVGGVCSPWDSNNYHDEISRRTSLFLGIYSEPKKVKSTHYQISRQSDNYLIAGLFVLVAKLGHA